MTKLATYTLTAAEIVAVIILYVAFCWYIPEITYSFMGLDAQWHAFIVSLGLFSVSSIAFFAAILSILENLK